MADLDFLIHGKKDPRYFVASTWGLKAQPPKPEFAELVERYLDMGQFDLIGPQHYGDYNEKKQAWEWWSFTKGRHWTWQQNLILTAVYRAVNGLGPKRVSIASGHGTGKTTTTAWLLEWFLFAFKEALVPCTAPTSTQMHDVLWKECMKWIQKMPTGLADLYDWTSSYIRIKEHPETWFARARTASKDKPEALAGLHAPYMMFTIDEASGVPEEVFNTAEGSLTEDNAFVLMISNPTRLTGHFYDSHHRDKENWQNITLNSEESPIVDAEYKQRIEDKHGKDSDEYRIRVQGKFPREDSVDKKGYVQLIPRKIINVVRDSLQFAGPKRLGIDPAGSGQNKTEWVIRDGFQAKIVMSQEVSDEKGIALITHGIVNEYDVPKDEIYIDAFGTGAKVLPHLYRIGVEAHAINVGDKMKDVEHFNPDEFEMEFLNLRAYAYWKTYLWLASGGRLVGDIKDWEQLLTVRSRRNLQGMLQIMPKQEMRKEGLPSPDKADALMLTFCDPMEMSVEDRTDRSMADYDESFDKDFNPYDLF